MKCFKLSITQDHINDVERKKQRLEFEIPHGNGTTKGIRRHLTYYMWIKQNEGKKCSFYHCFLNNLIKCD